MLIKPVVIVIDPVVVLAVHDRLAVSVPLRPMHVKTRDDTVVFEELLLVLFVEVVVLLADEVELLIGSLSSGGSVITIYIP